MVGETKTEQKQKEKKTGDNYVGVIMAGGAGTRFWPASTRASPKQFLAFFSERSLLQQAYDRVATLLPPARILVLTAKEHVDLCRAQLPDLEEHQIIGEPCRRDTAAAVALAALLAEKRFGDPTMMILTADHLMEPASEVHRTFRSALEGAAKGDALFTLGIEPRFPATGFGYLKLGEKVDECNGIAHHELNHFVEKPNDAKAREYFESGRYLWNSGMFFWRTSRILEEFQRYLPGHIQTLAPSVQEDQTSGFDARLATDFDRLSRISIDYGIMEKATHVKTAKASFEWSDIGSFPALADHLPQDAAHNAHRGHLYQKDASHNLVFCQDRDEIVTLIGVKDLVVVRAGERTLVVPKDRAQEVKDLVAMLPHDLQ